MVVIMPGDGSGQKAHPSALLVCYERQDRRTSVSRTGDSTGTRVNVLRELWVPEA